MNKLIKEAIKQSREDISNEMEIFDLFIGSLFPLRKSIFTKSTKSEFMEYMERSNNGLFH